EGLKTETRVEFTGGQATAVRDDSGDGTVPALSAKVLGLPAGRQFSFATLARASGCLNAEVQRRARDVLRGLYGDDVFADLPVLGRLAPEAAAAKLRELGELVGGPAAEAEAALPPSFGIGSWLWGGPAKPWQHTAHAFGYIAPAAANDAPLPIRPAGSIAADPKLKNARIKVTLDRLRVAAYPGGGTHRVLFDFYGQNQTSGGVEHLHFNAT